MLQPQKRLRLDSQYQREAIPVRLTSLKLRNYRVFEELDLEIPPGLVGIYGANGSGKSTLLEAIGWALYGRARTAKQQVRTTGKEGECRVELGFEHDEHHYRVIRSISGAASTTKARVLVGDLVAADGLGETTRYLRGLLGLDEHGFRSSVFAEQKQLAAFSDHRPEERRRLVLGLLGITTLDAARDSARTEARRLTDSHRDLRTRLVDPGPLELQLAELQASARRLSALLATAEGVARSATQLLRESDAELTALSERQSAYERIVGEGKLARAEIEQAERAVERLDQERLELARLGPLVERLQGEAATYEPLRREQIDVQEALAALHEFHNLGLDVVDQPPPTHAYEDDEIAADSSLRQARQSHQDATSALAAAKATLDGAERDLRRVEQDAQRSHDLQAGGSCPLCGHELGDGYEALLVHRQVELQTATESLAAARELHAVAGLAVSVAVEELRLVEREVEQHRVKQAQLRQVQARVAAAAQRWERVPASLRPSSGRVGEVAEKLHTRELRVLDELRRADEARTELLRATTKLERVEAVEQEWVDSNRRLVDSTARRTALREQLDGLGWRPDAYVEARAQREERASAAASAAEEARRLLIESTKADGTVGAVGDRLAQAKLDHANLDELSNRAALTAKSAEFIHLFRTSVVNAIGPHLSQAASSLFQELTDDEYDGLVVDPETYELQIIDGGTRYPTERFSGSEVDLANLAFRVAISEQLQFQPGGRVGLLVLDEALASLDADRKDRMLAALTRLSGRFRQILVVTHSPEVKEQLPRALHVIKRPGRRAEVISDDRWGA